VIHLTDAHCHLQDLQFSEDRTSVLERARTFGIRRFVVNGTCPEDWEEVAKLAQVHAEILPHFGVHPWKVEELSENWEERLKSYLLRFPNAGVGEIGLDRQLTQAPFGLQETVFQTQLTIAAELNRPCTLHVIKAWAEVRKHLQETSPSKILFHSYGGQDLGCVKADSFVSLGGAVLRPTLSKKVITGIQSISKDRLLLETDAPFQHPEGKANRQEPAGLLRIAEKVAEIRGVNIRDLCQQTEKNMERFLGRIPSRHEGL
jgi:TatD DNase family protein